MLPEQIAVSIAAVLRKTLPRMRHSALKFGCNVEGNYHTLAKFS